LETGIGGIEARHHELDHSGDAVEVRPHRGVAARVGQAGVEAQE